MITFEEYGDANGVPVIFCHGWPSSRTMARLTDEPARDLGIRIISPDRPGISGSSLQPNRKLTDWPRVIERIVDHLDIGEFRMLAISGGAPYAYATAASMPGQVRAIAIVSGATPIAELAHAEGLLPLYRCMLALYRTRPQLLRRLFYLARPILSLRPPPRLRPLLLKLLMLGKQDRAFSVHLAEEVAKRLRNCKARFIDDAGHYSLPIRYMREVLEDLISL